MADEQNPVERAADFIESQRTDAQTDEKADAGDAYEALAEEFPSLSEDDIESIIENAAEGADGDAEITKARALARFRTGLDGGTAEKANWVPYEGPQGGSGWQNVDTGDVTYSDDPPGDALEPGEISREDLENVDDPEQAGAIAAAMGVEEEFQEDLSDELGLPEDASPEEAAQAIEDNPDAMAAALESSQDAAAFGDEGGDGGPVDQTAIETGDTVTLEDGTEAEVVGTEMGGEPIIEGPMGEETTVNAENIESFESGGGGGVGQEEARDAVAGAVTGGRLEDAFESQEQSMELADRLADELPEDLEPGQAETEVYDAVSEWANEEGVAEGMSPDEAEALSADIAGELAGGGAEDAVPDDLPEDFTETHSSVTGEPTETPDDSEGGGNGGADDGGGAGEQAVSDMSDRFGVSESEVEGMVEDELSYLEDLYDGSSRDVSRQDAMDNVEDDLALETVDESDAGEVEETLRGVYGGTMTPGQVENAYDRAGFPGTPSDDYDQDPADVAEAVAEAAGEGDGGGGGGGGGGGDGGDEGSNGGSGPASQIADNAGDDLGNAWAAATLQPDSEMPDDPEEAARDIIESDPSMATNYVDDFDGEASAAYREYDYEAAEAGKTDEFMGALMDELESAGVPTTNATAGDFDTLVQMAGTDAVENAADEAGLEGGDQKAESPTAKARSFIERQRGGAEDDTPDSNAGGLAGKARRRFRELTGGE